MTKPRVCFTFIYNEYESVSFATSLRLCGCRGQGPFLFSSLHRVVYRSFSLFQFDSHFHNILLTDERILQRCNERVIESLQMQRSPEIARASRRYLLPSLFLSLSLSVKAERTGWRLEFRISHPSWSSIERLLPRRPRRTRPPVLGERSRTRLRICHSQVRGHQGERSLFSVSAIPDAR